MQAMVNICCRIDRIQLDTIKTDPVEVRILTEKWFVCDRTPRCLIPWFAGAILSQEWKEALWDKFVTGAPRPRTPSELQYSDRKLRSRSWAGSLASTPKQ